MRVNHRGAYSPMTNQFLHSADIIAWPRLHGSEPVSKGVTVSRLRKMRLVPCSLDCPLYHFIDIMTVLLADAGVHTLLARGENALSTPLTADIGVLSCQYK
jgi:hypothetical protein